MIYTKRSVKTLIQANECFKGLLMESGGSGPALLVRCVYATLGLIKAYSN
jgi:hypothetical protein